MAESFVFHIANSLLGKLASYAYEEASRGYGVYDDLQHMKDTLSIVRGVLLDAEYKKDQKHGVREWMRQIQNICSDAEDVFDGFEFQHKRKQVAQASNSTRTKVRQLFSSSNPIVLRPMMAHQIKDIKERLDKVATDGNKFGLANIDVGPPLVLQRRESTHSHVDASDVIGRENDKEEIIKLLMQPYPKGNGDKSLCVISIVGIGGLGKTTLAKFVFNDKRMDELFMMKMWVCISDYDDFDLRQILIKIINTASASASTLASVSAPRSVALVDQENINNLDIEQLQSHTLETLQVYELPHLKTLPECLTTMTRLKRLWISRCPQLSSFPSDFHCLTALEHLYIYDCPELYLKCQPKSGEYWPMIARMKITSIEILQREVKE
ncbi:hypothetical protein RYX36_030897 [Vicia faba]